MLLELYHKHIYKLFKIQQLQIWRRFAWWLLINVANAVVPVHFNWAPRLEGVLGSGGIAPHILDGTRWRCVVSFTTRPLYPHGKRPSYPLDRRLGGPQGRFGRCGEEINSHPLPGLEPPIVQPVAHRCTAELSWLLCNWFYWSECE
jgi:hypothetical protein